MTLLCVLMQTLLGHATHEHILISIDTVVGEQPFGASLPYTHNSSPTEIIFGCSRRSSFAHQTDRDD